MNKTNQFTKDNQPGCVHHGKGCCDPRCHDERIRSQGTQDSPNIKADVPFYCSVDWHLARQKSTALVLIYNLAARIAHNSGVFRASAAQVARYFDYSEKTVLTCFKHLVKLGFFETQLISLGEPNRYRVINHQEWAETHPRNCPEKEWSFAELTKNDPERVQRAYELGRELHAISGGTVNFEGWVLDNYLRTQTPSEEIINKFRLWWPELLAEVTSDPERSKNKRWRLGVQYYFYKHLQTDSDVLAISDTVFTMAKRRPKAADIERLASEYPPSEILDGWYEFWERNSDSGTYGVYQYFVEGGCHAVVLSRRNRATVSAAD